MSYMKRTLDDYFTCLAKEFGVTWDFVSELYEATDGDLDRLREMLIEEVTD